MKFMCNANISHAEVLSLFAGIRYGKYKGILTPHKQLLIIFMLAKYRCNYNRLIPYHEIDYALSKIAKRYFPEIKVFHANYPFWRLQNDKIWEVTNKELLSHQLTKKDINRWEFLEQDVHGGFTPAIYQAISTDTSLLDTLVKIVAGNLPNDKRSAIVNDMGLNEVPGEIFDQCKSKDFLELFIQEDSEEYIVLN